MAADIFIYIDSIPGESSDTTFEDWIEVNSYDVGVEMEAAGSRSTSGGASAGRADLNDFEFTKQMDLASTKLLEACTLGTVFQAVKIFHCQAGGVASGSRNVFAEYVLTDMIITSVSLSGSDGVPEESVAFNYGGILWRYHHYTHDTNRNTNTKREGAWSTVKNKPELPAAGQTLDGKYTATTANSGGAMKHDLGLGISTDG